MKSVLLRLALLFGALAAPTIASAQWERIPGFDGRFFDEVFFTDANHGWVAESLSPNIVMTTDAGRSWTTSQVPGAGSKMRDICFVNNQIGFVSGSDGIFKTTNGGRTWLDIAPDSTGVQPALWFRNANEGVVGLGGCNSDIVTFLYTDDGGANWTPTQYNAGLDASVGGIRYDGGVWYAVGGMGKMWTSVDGLNWDMEDMQTAGWHEDVDVNGGTVFTVARIGNSCDDGSASDEGHFMVRARGATQWTRTINALPFAAWGVSALSPTEAWACGDKGSIYRTTDGGNWWYPYSCGLDDDDRVDDIAFIDATNGWAVGDGIFMYNGRVDILSVNASPSVTINAGESTQLQASGGVQYHWEPSAGLSDPDVANPVATPSSTTTYTVTVTSDRGCTGTASVTVTVVSQQQLALAFEMPSVTADVRDDNVEIPILGTVTTPNASTDAESMTITISFNASTFFPRSTSRGTIKSSSIVDGKRMLTITFTRAELADVDELLTTITGNAMLGNAAESAIILEDAMLDDQPLLHTATTGRLTLTGICTGGDEVRLLETSGLEKLRPDLR